MIDTNTIWHNFHQNMHGYLRKRVKNTHDADDLLQEIFLKIHLKIHTLDKSESLPAWVWQLTRHTLIDYYKKRRLRSASIDEAAQTPSDFVQEDYNELLASCIQPYLDLLPPGQREALVLADLNHIPQKNLAEKWGISHSGAKSRVQRARGELYGLFQQCCHIEADKYGNIIRVECWDK